MVSIKYKCTYLSGRCVSAVALVRFYGVTDVEPTQGDKPLLSSKRSQQFQTYKPSWKEQKLDHGSRRSWKPRTIVLARTSCSLLDWTDDSICLIRAVQLGAAAAYLALFSVGVFMLWRSISCVMSCGMLVNDKSERIWDEANFTTSLLDICFVDWGEVRRTSVKLGAIKPDYFCICLSALPLEYSIHLRAQKCVERMSSKQARRAGFRNSQGYCKIKQPWRQFMSAASFVALPHVLHTARSNSLHRIFVIKCGPVVIYCTA
jgi:hypothetical protein